MATKIIDRFDEYMSYKHLNDNKVTVQVGLSNGTIGKSRKDGRDLSDRVVEQILNFYTDLSRQWLLYGEGEMLKPDTQFVECEEVDSKRMANVSLLSADDEIEIDLDGLMNECNITALQIATIIGEDTTYLTRGKLKPRHIIALQKHCGTEVVDEYAKYTSNIKAEVIESFPIVPEAVTTNPNTDIVKYVEENGSELETINPNQLLNDAKVDVAERIKRTSMLPTFQPDDTVFIRFIKDKMKIVDGETYYLDCKNRPTMIRMVKFEPDGKLRLIAKNSQYGDIVIDRTDIINIGVVVALFRMTFGDQYSEMEAIRRHKDEQLEERHQQINNFIDIQREMIAEIREQGKRNERERERTDRLIDKLIEK